MADNGTVGGLQPLGDRFDQKPQWSHQEAPQQAPRQPSGGHAEADSVDLSPTAAAAFALLEQRVLAATRLATPESSHPIGTIVRGQGPSTPAAVVAWIQSSQHWCLGSAVIDALLLQRAFIDGLDETEAILRDVAPGDASLMPWFAAVRAIVASEGR